MINGYGLIISAPNCLHALRLYPTAIKLRKNVGWAKEERRAQHRFQICWARYALPNLQKLRNIS